MLSYDIVKNNPAVFLAMTSLHIDEFQALLLKFNKAWHNQATQSNRKRKKGAGRKPKLQNRADQLFFILFYLKTYPLQSVLGFLFGMSQTQANMWIHRLSHILKSALEDESLLPVQEGERLEAILSENSSHVYAQDGCERKVQRPVNSETQTDFYSGKKKTHTAKHLLVAHLEQRRISFLSKVVGGKKHDKKLADESDLTFPRNSLLEQDTGFQGYNPDDVLIIQPKKKPRKKELTIGEKFVNRCISSDRVLIENIIASVKRCRIVKDIFRNWKDGFSDLVMLIACGLHNLRTDSRQPTESINLLELYFQ